jgi:hypothetical protein
MKKWNLINETLFSLFLISFYGVVLYMAIEEQIPSGIDPELKEYVATFEKKGKRFMGADFHVPNMDIGFSRTRHLPTDDGGRIVGMCDPYIPVRTVVFDKETWPTYSDSEKEELVFHELGHCVLDRDHDSTKIDGMPMSIMYPYDSIPAYPIFRDAYIKELFTKDAIDITKALKK